MRLLHTDKPHGRSSGGVSNRCGVDGVILVALHLGLDELRGDDAHIVANLLELPGQPLRARAGFHGYQRPFCTLEEL